MPVNVYACGSNGKSQLGNGSDEDLNTVELVFTTENNVNVKDIVCGGNHTFILLENGDLYASGDNSYGQCGINDESSLVISHFTLVPKIDGLGWIKASAGFEYSVLVNENHDVYSVGLGLKGELGLGANITKSNQLHQINHNLGKVVHLRACLDHTIFLNVNGDLYGWGNGRSGKLGNPPDGKIWEPRLIRHDIDDAKVGRDFTLFRSKDGFELIGKDKFNLLQNSDLVDVKDFKTMWSSVHFITTDNEIVSFGNNSHGQILNHRIEKSDNLAVGSEHALILRGNEVLAWGWGEHGNCGINSKEESVTFDYLNPLYHLKENEKVSLLAGGCATTWIVTNTSDD